MIPWWVHLLVGLFAGSFGMYGPAYKKGRMDAARSRSRTASSADHEVSS